MAAAPGASPPRALADGAHSFTATATDAAGNTSAASTALEVTVDTWRRRPGDHRVLDDSGAVGDASPRKR